MTANNVTQRWSASPIGDVNNANAGSQLEKLASHVGSRAVSRRGRVELAGIGFGDVDQLAQRFCRKLRIDLYDVRRCRHPGNGRKAADRIVAGILEKSG